MILQKTKEIDFINLAILSKLGEYKTTITPEMASNFLSRTRINRPISRRFVDLYISDIKEDRWVENGLPIIFNEFGELIDGQHRLTAIVKSGISQNCWIWTGRPNDLIRVLDIGKPRSAVDIGKISGIQVSHRYVACVNSLILPSYKKNNFSKTKCLEILQGIEYAIKFACDSSRKEIAVVTALIAKAYFYENKKRLLEFLQVLATGFPESLNAEEDYAAISLKNHFELLRMQKRFHLTNEVKGELYLKSQSALQSFLDRYPLKKIRTPGNSNDKYPLPGICIDSEENRKRINKYFQGYEQNDSAFLADIDKKYLL